MIRTSYVSIGVAQIKTTTVVFSLSTTASPRHPQNNDQAYGVGTVTNKGPRAGHRVSQNLLGSRLPTSIPSSPTSIHFLCHFRTRHRAYRTSVEPIVPPSPPHALNHPPNPHRIPCAKGTELLENAVTSVLDSAATVLGSINDGGEVAIVAPALGTYDSLSMGKSSGFASPIGSIRSRSLSPLGIRGGVGQGHARAELLLSIPHQPAQSVLGLQNIVSPSISLSGPTLLRPQIKATDTAATITQVSSSNDSVAGSSSPPQSPPPPSISVPSEGASPADATEDPSPHDGAGTPTKQLAVATSLCDIGVSVAQYIPLAFGSSATTKSAGISSRFALHRPIASIASLSRISRILNLTSSHPPSPIHVAQKRLSFMTYTDLLSLTPATLQPLSSLMMCVSTSEPPPHIPSVSGLNIGSQSWSRNTSAAPSLRDFSMGSSTAGTSSGPTDAITHAGKRNYIAILDNIGGEWGRLALGRGLEERLEALKVSKHLWGISIRRGALRRSPKPVAFPADRKA